MFIATCTSDKDNEYKNITKILKSGPQLTVRGRWALTKPARIFNHDNDHKPNKVMKLINTAQSSGMPLSEILIPPSNSKLNDYTFHKFDNC